MPEENTTKEAESVSKSALSDLLCLKYEYLVSYFGKDSIGACNGRSFISRDKPISCADDVEQLEAFIVKNNSAGLCVCGIISFQLLRTYEA